jgi:hypothetical protein
LRELTDSEKTVLPVCHPCPTTVPLLDPRLARRSALDRKYHKPLKRRDLSGSACVTS